MVIFTAIIHISQRTAQLMNSCFNLLISNAKQISMEVLADYSAPCLTSKCDSNAAATGFAYTATSFIVTGDGEFC